ncbi:MAG: hypothetical protein AABW54_01535 [Candidatus Micrarchaeota archaeon]
MKKSASATRGQASLEMLLVLAGAAAFLAISLGASARLQEFSQVSVDYASAQRNLAAVADAVEFAAFSSASLEVPLENLPENSTLGFDENSRTLSLSFNSRGGRRAERRVRAAVLLQAHSLENGFLKVFPSPSGVVVQRSDTLTSRE